MLAVALLAGCSSGSRAPRTPAPPPSDPGAGVAAAERDFLVGPFEGWTGAADPAFEERLSRAHRELLRSGDAATARAEAEAVLAEATDFAPASVLLAQADLLAGDAEAAFDRADPLVVEMPLYTAAQLVRGRAAEALSRVPEAFASYRAVADASAAAAGRASELSSRAIEIVTRRFRSSVDQGDLEAAAAHLERLRRWAPDSPEILEGARELAEARGDLPAELVAVRSLLEREPDRRDLLERRGELELEVGDPSAGLQIFQRLAEANPDDPEVQGRLERAKFRWRLTLLPAHVQDISRKAELTRADFATLVHWLVPRVRSARAQGGTIANDILDHPRREEITRVVNLGLMEVDATLHAFSPERPVRRERALASLLRAIERLGTGACGAAAPTCEAAVACGLIVDGAACADPTPISGTEALELIRRALQRF